MHGGRGKHSFGDVYYSFSEDASDNTANGWFNIEADEYELQLKGSMGFSHEERRMNPECAAEALWVEFLGQAGVSYE
ncbi:hypothetical protein RGUI_3200 [Rhodovulum sp. P5]|nr:hypothetical protein RGUI_3200 [Rhodovulum sp. P5]